MFTNHNYNVPFRCFTNGAHGSRPITSSHERTALLAFVLAAALVMALAAGAMLHAGEPGQTIVPHQSADDTGLIQDLVAFAPLPGYAFAQTPQDDTPPTFVSSGLNLTAGNLAITFSEAIDVTSAANVVVPSKIHIRESGNYTGGITLSAGEFVTVVNGTAISFTLTPSHLTTVTGLTMPELTIEPGAVQDTSGNLIVGTFDASTAVFVDATSIKSEDIDPRDMTFSNDGTKMFVVGNKENAIIEYTLSQAFDASTANFTDTFSVSSEEDVPTGMAFSNNGTKMFVVGYSGTNVTEYTLPTAFDISNVVFAGTFSVSSEYAWSSDITFSNDGTKMFVVNLLHDMITEYILSSAFNVSAAVFVSPFSVASEETYPTGMTFSNDGAKMFVVGDRGEAVNEYALMTAFNITTAVFVDATLISSEDIYLTGVAFSNDGAKMFVVENDAADIHEYTLSSVYPITVNDTVAPDTTPPSISGAVAASLNSVTVTFSENVDADATNGLHWSLDGTDAGSLTVSANTDPAGSSNSMTLTLSGNLPDTGPDLTLIYTRPNTGGITDGNNQLEDETVTVVDGIAPTVTGARAASGTVVTLTISEDVSDASAAPGDFSLSGVASSPTVSSISVSGKTVTLTLSSAIITSDSPLLSYTRTSGSIQDISNNSLADFSSVVVDTSPDNTPPSISGAVAASLNSITVTFSENVDADATNGLHWSLGGTDAGSLTVSANTDPAGSSNSMTLTLSGNLPDTGPDLTLIYTRPNTGGITDGNNQLEDETVTVVDGIAPTVTGARAASGTVVTLTISEDVSDASAAPGDFSLSGVASSPTVSSISVSGKTVTLTLSSAIVTSDSPLLSYTRTSGSIQDISNNSLADFSSVVVDTSPDNTPPSISGAVAASLNSITVTFSENVDADATNGLHWSLGGTDAGSLTVSANTDPAGSSNSMTLTLSGNLPDTGPDLTLIYTRPNTGGITDGTNQLEDETVTVVDGIAPTVTGARAASGTVVTLTISEDVSDASAAPGDFSLSGVASSPTVSSISVSGKTVTLTLSSAIVTSDSPLLSYSSTTGSIQDASSNSLADFSSVAVDTSPDTTPPTLSLTGNTSVTISVGTTYNDEGAICEDAVDGTIIPTVVSNTVDTTQVGTYAVTYSCTDAANNSAIQVTRTVTVEAAPDTTPPTLSITGNTSVTISVGTTYNDEGAICEDAVDGTIIPTVVSDTVDTTQVGTYAVTYSCTDAANNSAIQVTRTVTVEAAPDTTPPTLSITGNTSVTISVGTTYNDEGAICEDAVDGTIIPTVVSDTVDTTQVGTYAVTYSCTDAANNSAIQVTRTVTVEAAPDTTPPTLSLTGNTSVTISVGTTYNDEGAICEDAVDGTIIPTVVSNTVDTTQTGTYAVTYSCTDAANNSATQVSRTVIVQTAVIPDTDRSSKSSRSNNTPNPLTTDNSIIIDGQSYDLGSGTTTTTNPYDITTGQATDLVFTAYSPSDIVRFTIYLNLHGDDIKHSDSDTYIRYDHGVVEIVDPHGFISDASITITEDSEQSRKKIINTLVEFEGNMGLTNMVVYIWNEDRRYTSIRMFNALDITSGTETLPDPEPVESDSGLPADPESVTPGFEDDAVDPEPVPADTLGPDDYDDAQVLHTIRMWSGFESEFITDTQLLELLGLEDYQDVDLPDWMMTELGVLVAKGDVTVGEFVLALQYMLTHA